MVKVKIICEAVFSNTDDECKVVIYVDNKKAGSADLFREKGNRFYIDWVHIQHRYRGMGNGVKMLTAIGKFADKRGWTLVLHAYPDLVHFYNLSGFKAFKISDQRVYMSRKPR